MYNPLYRGKISRVPSRANTTGYTNGTLTGMLIGAPVSVDTSSNIAPTDVSDETSVMRFLGITGEAIPSAASGQVFSNGRASSLASQLTGFAYGDPVYIGKSGTLTNIKPDVGVNSFVTGDWVVFLGVVVKNEFDPSEKDIQLLIEVIGQL